MEEWFLNLQFQQYGYLTLSIFFIGFMLAPAAQTRPGLKRRNLEPKTLHHSTADERDTLTVGEIVSDTHNRALLASYFSDFTACVVLIIASIIIIGWIVLLNIIGVVNFLPFGLATICAIFLWSVNTSMNTAISQ